MSSLTAAPVAASSRRTIRGLLTIFTLVAAMIVPAVVGAQSASASTTAMTSLEKTYANAVLALMNIERSAHHLPALTLRSSLLTSSRRHDIKMAYYNKMSHQLPGEAAFYDRIENAGYYWTWCGENIAWNSNISVAGVRALETMMYNEVAPNNAHRLNILNSHYANVGIDIYIDLTHHKVWMTQDFGHL